MSMAMYDKAPYVTIIHRINFSDHALQRYYNRMPVHAHQRITEIKKKVARKLYDEIRVGCDVENDQIDLMIFENFMAVVIPKDDGWLVTTFFRPNKSRNYKGDLLKNKEAEYA